MSGLNSGLLELAEATCQLLAEYHDVFSLEPMELGCTHSTERTIKVTDDTPFKKGFRQIPPPLVEEAQSHLREMLESGAIQPSQSAWCNSGDIGESSRCLKIFVPRPQVRVLPDKNGGDIKTIYCLHSGQLGVFQVQPLALWAMQCAGHISETDAELSWQIKPHLLPYLSRQYNYFLADGGRTSPQVVCSL